MAERKMGPINLKKARVLICNDDGMHAPGIKLLQKAVAPLVREVWVVAPETEQSAASHSLTLRRPLRIRKASDGRYGVDGTPTDSVLLGISQVMRETPPDLVLSGINRGGNLGEDVTYSGTIAAAMEAALLGVPAIAFSQVADDRRNARWKTAETWLPKVLRKLAKMEWPKDVLMSVNFPDTPAGRVTGIEVARQGQRKIGGALQQGEDPRGEPYYWVGIQRIKEQYLAGTDLDVVSRGGVAVTPLTLDLTHAATLKKMKAAFK